MISRRLFLRAAPAATAALPSAVKSLTDKVASAEAMSLTDVSVGTVGMSSAAYRNVPWFVSRWFRSAAGRAATALGLEPPEIIKREIDNSLIGVANRMHPDLAALKSVSLSAKVVIQDRRNKSRIISIIEREVLMDDLREAFIEKFKE